MGIFLLTHSGRVTHIYVGNLTIIGSDNGLSPGRRQAITLTNAGLWGPYGADRTQVGPALAPQTLLSGFVYVT